jgi:hypothetical protein
MNIEDYAAYPIWSVEHIIWFAWYYLDIVIQPHQIPWLKNIIENKKSLTMGPRGHGKTTTLIKVLLTYAICHDPEIKILLASHKEAVAKRQARLIMTALLRKKIRQDFEIEKGSVWTRVEAYLKHEGQEMEEPFLFCVAGSGGMTGYRFDWMVFDDLLVKENQKSEKLRKKLLEWLEDEVLKARDPGEKQKVIVLGTRKHYKDWYRALMESGEYSLRVDKAIQEDGSVLWPNLLDVHGNIVQPMFTLEELRSRKKSEGIRSFAQEYQNEPNPPQGDYLLREWLKYYTDLPPSHCLNIYMGVDPSGGSEAERASSLAVAVIAHDTRPSFNNIYVLELYKQKMSLGAQFTKIQELYDKWHPLTTNVEAVLFNKNFAEQIIRRIPNAYPIDYIHSRLQGTGETQKELRIKNYVGIMFEEGKILLKDPAYDYQTREFIEEEYITFPEKGEDKDLLDALTLAVDLVEISPAMNEPVFYSF